MSDLPSEMYLEILMRVPAKPLLTLRSVCKLWRQIIDDPHFIRSHLLRLDINKDGYQLIMLHDFYFNEIFVLPLYSHSFCRGRRPQFVDGRCIEIVEDHKSLSESILMESSCDGLVLIKLKASERLIWNPITTESFVLPPLQIPGFVSDLCKSGLGFDRSSNSYKVVRLCQYKKDMDDFKICTSTFCLKSKEWKRIEDFPSIVVYQDCCGVYFNNALHWLTSGKGLVSLDLATENYSVLQLPSLHEKLNNHNDCRLYLNVFNGNFYLSCCSYGRYDCWALEKHGGKDSWKKMFSLTKLDDLGFTQDIKPLEYLKSKEKVLILHDDNLFWIDVDNKSARLVIVNGYTTPACLYNQAIPASLVQLQTPSGTRNNHASHRIEFTFATTDDLDSQVSDDELNYMDNSGSTSGVLLDD